MKPEHRAAIEGIKLSMLDKWNKGETHPPTNSLLILWLVDRIEELEQELKNSQVEDQGMSPDTLRQIIVNQALPAEVRREAWYQLVQVSQAPGAIRRTLEDLDVYASIAWELWNRTGDTPWGDIIANFIGSDTEIKR